MEINRKILCDLAINEPYSFKAFVDEVKIQGKIEVYNLYPYCSDRTRTISKSRSWMPMSRDYWQKLNAYGSRR
jgi:hypothetical protein